MDFTNASDSDDNSMREVNLNEEDGQTIDSTENESIGEIKNKMENTIIEHQKIASTFRMYLCSFLCLLPGFTGGAAISYAAIALPYYMDPENSSGIVMSESQASWFVSLKAPMQMLGNLVAGGAMEKFGRKTTITFSSILLILSSAILALAPNYELLLIGGFLNGTSVGLVRPAIVLQLSEIGLIRLRGLMGSLMTLTPNVGYLYGLLLGALVPVNLVPWVVVGPCVLYLLLSWTLVESPVWLVQQGRSSEARLVLSKLRGPVYNPEPEIAELENLLSKSSQGFGLVELTRRSFLTPLLVLAVIFFSHASVGWDILSYYGLTIFKFPGVDISPGGIAMMYQSSFTLGLLLAPLLMSRVGRRIQFISGGLGLCCSLLVLGAYYKFSLFSSDPSLSWIPVFIILLNGLVFGLGLGPVPYTLAGEVFPQHMKSVGSGITTASRYAGQFVQLKIFPLLREGLGLEGVFWMNAATSLAACIFVYIFLPETRNKTYTELSNIFKKRRKEDVDNSEIGSKI